MDVHFQITTYKRVNIDALSVAKVCGLECCLDTLSEEVISFCCHYFLQCIFLICGLGFGSCHGSFITRKVCSWWEVILHRVWKF